MRPIYLDNNATTRADPGVVAEMVPYFSEFFGNASSQHGYGAPVAAAVRTARQALQNLLGAAESEIVFTSGGTESDNAAILSALETQDGRDEIITTTVEHAAVLSLVGHLEKTRAIKVHYVEVDTAGRLDIETFKRLLGPRTAIASIMWANNETGTIFPVAELADLTHAAGALFHTDAVQVVGKLPIDVKATQIDFLSLSGHKLHGPKGIGALYIRKGVKYTPLIRGGHQERGRRGGTENVPGIIGLGKAAELAVGHLQEESGRVRRLRDRLEQSLVQRIGYCRVNGDHDNRLPNTSNIAFDHLDSEAILTNLDRAGIAASSGSACTAGSTMPSHVLKAMRVPASALQGVVRFSLSRETTSEEIDRVLETMPQIIQKLRAMSPYWAERSAQTDELATSSV
jgi:cysteine desulfurase